MKRLVALLLTVLCASVLLLSAYANASIPIIDDRANLLSLAEENDLIYKAEELSHTYQADICILTVDTLAGSYADAYADQYYVRNCFNEDGILLLLAMAEREWYIYTHGDLIYKFTDQDIQELGLEFTDSLANGNYHHAFDLYLRALPCYLDHEESKPSFLISLVTGLLAAGITVGIMSASMNTKRRQNAASEYLQNNSFRLRTHQDLYLYSKVDKVRRQQNNNSSGKTTVHRSSGGGRHGGGGGKF